MPEIDTACVVCDDDGYIEVWDDDGMQIVATRECPHLHEHWHRPFGASGILGATPSTGERP